MRLKILSRTFPGLHLTSRLTDDAISGLENEVASFVEKTGRNNVKIEWLQSCSVVTLSNTVVYVTLTAIITY